MGRLRDKFVRLSTGCRETLEGTAREAKHLLQRPANDPEVRHEVLAVFASLTCLSADEIHHLLQLKSRSGAEDLFLEAFLEHEEKIDHSIVTTLLTMNSLVIIGYLRSCLPHVAAMSPEIRQALRDDFK